MLSGQPPEFLWHEGEQYLLMLARKELKGV